MVIDKQGNRYIDVDEAMAMLGVKRSTLQRLVASLEKYRRPNDRKHYYREGDIEALKEEQEHPDQMLPVKREPMKDRRAA